MRRVGLFLAACVAVVSAAGLWAQQADSIPSTNNPAEVPQSVPRLIMLSGTVKDLTGKPLTGPVDLNFAIYKEQADAAPLWQESQTLNVDEQGHYTAIVGAMQPEGLPVDLFTSGEARWLGVSVGKLPEQPRVLLVSVPYALKANDAEMLGGKPASAYALAPAAGSGTSQGLGTAGATAPGGAAASELAAPGTPKSGATPNVAGTGTQNYIPLWTNSTGTLGNSVIYQSSGLLGIGTTTPGGKLDVAGSVGHFQVDTSGAQFRFSRGGANYFLASTAGGYFDFVANGLTPSDANASLKLAANGVVNFMAGNVGIGTLTPAQKLEVAGNIKSSGNVTATGSVTAASFSGNGSGLTSLNASNLGSGTVPPTALSGTYPITISGNAASATNAANSVELGGVAAASYARLDVGNSFTGNQTVTTGTFGVGVGAPDGYIADMDQTDTTANSNLGTALYGVAANASGIKTFSEGADIEAFTTGTGTVSTNNALYVISTQAGGGTITQNQGIYIDQASAGTGTIGNNVGLQIADQTAGSVNYSILTGMGPVSFGDKLGIGTTTPAHMLDVVGDINASSNITTGGVFTGNGSGLTNVSSSTATTASGLSCTGCVGNTQLGVNYAGSSSKGGAAANALLLNGLAASAFQAAGSYAVKTGPNSFTGTQTVTGGSVGIGTTGPVSALNVAGTTGLTWIGGGTNLGLATLGTPGTGGSLYLNTPSGSSTYQSGLGIDGTYGTPSQQSVINLKALGVKSGGGYGSQLAFWTTNGAALNQQMTITNTGNVGIGTSSPATTLQVVGDIRVGTSGTNGCLQNNAGTALAGTCSSDARLKTNIHPFSPVLTKLAQLQPVHFNWRTAAYPEYHFGSGANSGLIAQEVEKVFPELVSVDAKGFKQVNYSELPYLMLQAIRELKGENDRLRTEKDGVQRQIATLEARLAQIEARTAKPRPKSVKRAAPAKPTPGSTTLAKAQF